MKKKYINRHPFPYFTEYSDPYGERKINGPLHPQKPIISAEPSFHRSYDDGKLYFSWLGHASVFLHLHGLNILVDPVFSTYSAPLPRLGPKRFEGRILKEEELPEIDLVLITHNHYDHLDAGTIRRLDAKVHRYLVPEGVRHNLKCFGISAEKIDELRWFEEANFNGLKAVLIPSQHNSGRSLFDLSRTLWGGYILKDERYTVIDTGDGGYDDRFVEIRERYGKVDLGIMECGQYGEKWHGLHMFPEESAEAAHILEASLAVPVHWGTYCLSTHAWDEPPKRFAQRSNEIGLNYRIPCMYELLCIEKDDRGALTVTVPGE